MNIEKAKKELENVNHVYELEVAVIDEILLKKTTSFQSVATKEYPMPEEPVKPL